MGKKQLALALSGKNNLEYGGTAVKSTRDEKITKEILTLLHETFIEVHGLYLDKGTSFLETLDKIDFTKASIKYANFDETIAGHISHVIYYIIVLQEYITDKRTGKTDWKESWKNQNVTELGWKELKESLEASYSILVDFIESIEDWNKGDYLGGILSILMHCSYHLGSVRQLINIEGTS
jgi:hypothetical protein